jgi:phosphonoacetaldehyde hydrolase
MALKAVIFDWAGTMVDFGSRAPVEAFRTLFAEFGTEITEAEARGPMGLNKIDHIRALLAMPRIAEAWGRNNGTADESAVERLFARFRELDREVVARFTDLIPGAAGIVEALRGRGMKIGSSTGYNRDVMDAVLKAAARQGYRPDNLVCADDLPLGRPSPMMMYKCFLDLQVWPASAVVKVDDTVPGILEGRAAGSWTVGLALSGNAAGIGVADLGNPDAPHVEAARQRAREVLAVAEPDYIIDTVADLLPVLDEIEQRMA